MHNEQWHVAGVGAPAGHTHEHPLVTLTSTRWSHSRAPAGHTHEHPLVTLTSTRWSHSRAAPADRTHVDFWRAALPPPKIPKREDFGAGWGGDSVVDTPLLPNVVRNWLAPPRVCQARRQPGHLRAVWGHVQSRVQVLPLSQSLGECYRAQLPHTHT
jgi:hypothetical protein